MIEPRMDSADLATCGEADEADIGRTSTELPGWRPQPRSRFTGQRIHFIGIGGCGMNGLARMLIDAGAVVGGSETQPNKLTQALTQLGARISSSQRGELLSTRTDLVVRTAAVKDDNPEFQAALAMGLPTLKYAQLLGLVMAERLGVAVGGTHGKSTTTAMTAYALMQCGADPSFVVGGTARQLGGTGSRSGRGRAFVAEACEYDRSFHSLRPRICVITNVEGDHFDCYRNLGEIIDAFGQFARLTPADGRIIANGNDPNVRAALRGAAAPIEWVTTLQSGECSPNERSGWVTQVGSIENGGYTGIVHYRGKPLARLKLNVAGWYNLSNATLALAACRACGADVEAAAAAISAFTGVDRRMEEVGAYRDATIVDDYGHHPTEIRETLRALRERYSPRRLYCVFQPHQHSRTRTLMEEFAGSFASADQVIVPDIYFVRDSEEERLSVTAEHLVRRINVGESKALHLADFSQIVAHLRENVRRGDLVVTMGAGDVYKVGKELAGLNGGER